MTSEGPRIHDYAVVGDSRSAALISRRGSLDWLCWPRFDSPSLFGAILDPQAGRFSIAPVGELRSERWYAPDTNVLCTRFSDADGEVVLTDFMPALAEPERRRLMLPERELIRLVECNRGELDLEICFEPRPDYGRERCDLTDAGRLGVAAITSGYAANVAYDSPVAYWRLDEAAGPSAFDQSGTGSDASLSTAFTAVRLPKLRVSRSVCRRGSGIRSCSRRQDTATSRPRRPAARPARPSTRSGRG